MKLKVYVYKMDSDLQKTLAQMLNLDENDEKIQFLLSASNNNLETALELYFEQFQQQPTGNNYNNNNNNNNNNSNKIDDNLYTIEQIDDNIFKIVEEDKYKQYPFFYVILCKYKCIIIDTGCGLSNPKKFILENINKQKLPFIIIHTHIHFDHCSGTHYFEEDDGINLLGILNGNQNQKFSNNLDICSLCMAHNCSVKPFKVTNWLEEGDAIDLDAEGLGLIEADSIEQQSNLLQVIFTPGHSLDSISLLYANKNRIFTGDLIYQYTAVGLSSVGSNVNDYLVSLKKLINLCNDHKDLKASCGHVDSNLPLLQALLSAQEFIVNIKQGKITPVGYVEEGVAEYSNGTFSFTIDSTKFT